MSQKEAILIIPAIENGTVIDHIPIGLGIKMIHLLKLEDPAFTVTLAMHLRSKKIGFKDLIKIENLYLSEKDVNKIAVFAPHGTINIIKNFKIEKKIRGSLPESIEDILICPNNRCITRHEKCSTLFFVKEHKQKVYLTCKYCQKDFLRDEIKDYSS
jgi:aspartate carbamoyltransferase regulatory subunit